MFDRSEVSDVVVRRKLKFLQRYARSFLSLFKYLATIYGEIKMSVITVHNNVIDSSAARLC